MRDPYEIINEGEAYCSKCGEHNGVEYDGNDALDQLAGEIAPSWTSPCCGAELVDINGDEWYAETHFEREMRRSK